jgi:hypothetical protein
MRAVALQAIRRSERLILMGRLQACILRVMALDAERRNFLLQMRRKLDLVAVPILMSDMAGLATHIEGGMTAATFWDVDADVVAAQAEVLIARRARHRLQKLVRIVGLMRIVALQAITDSRRMHRLSSLNLLLIMAAQAESLRRRGDQLHPSHIAGDANFVAAQASSRDRRMHCLSFALVFMAFEALRGIYILLERNRVSFGYSRRNCTNQKKRDPE